MHFRESTFRETLKEKTCQQIWAEGSEKGQHVLQHGQRFMKADRKDDINNRYPNFYQNTAMFRGGLHKQAL